MAEEKSANVSSFNSIPLAIVDILGALVPGIAWLTLLLILVHVLLTGGINFDFEYSKAAKIVNSPSSIFQSAVLIIYLAVSLVVGYMVKAFAMGMAGFIESCFISLNLFGRHLKALSHLYPHLKKQRSFRRKFNYIRRRCKFPYNVIHERRAYFGQLNEIIRQHSDLPVKDLPMKGPFSYCKRLIKISSPALWEESVQLEAEVRMLGSLFLASFTGFLMSLFASMISQRSIFLKVAFITLFLSILFGVAFSKRRRDEVRYTYLNTILIRGEQNQRPSGVVAQKRKSRVNARFC